MKRKDFIFSPHEWLLLAGVSAALIVLTGVPYLLGWFLAPPGRSYDGLHALSPGDVPVYYSYIRQAVEGEVFFTDRFTTEPQTLGTLNLWWLGVGSVAGLLHLSPPLAFQLSRLAMIPVLVVVLYACIARLFEKNAQRKIALFFSLLASGLGGYAAAFLTGLPVDGPDSYWWPIDLWLTEASMFNALYQTSHFIASLVATLGIFFLTMRSWETGSPWLAFVSGVLGLAYFNFHPYYAPTVYGALGLYWLVGCIRERKIFWYQGWQLGLMVAVSFPSVLYHAWLLKESSVIAGRALQNVTTISPWPYVLIGYGFLIPAALLGLYAVLRTKRWRGWWQLIALWLAVNVILIYSPFPFHSRYTQGVGLVLSLYSVAGLVWLYELLQQRLPARRFSFWVKNPALLTMLFFILFAPSTMMSIIRDVYHFIYKPGKVFSYYYLPKGLYDAYTWLSAQPRGQTVLAFDPADKFVPGFSGQQSYAAHGHETLFYQSKITRVRWFFSSNDDDDAKRQFLRDEGIDFVIYSEYEKALGDFDPDSKAYVTRAFEAPDVVVYRVVTE